MKGGGPPYIINILLISLLLSSGYKSHVRAQIACRSQILLAMEGCALGATDIGDDDEEDRLLRNRHPGYLDEVGDEDENLDESASNEDDPMDTACCRRLSGLDSACVCQVVQLSKIPLFVTKNNYKLTLMPNKGCELTFECNRGARRQKMNDESSEDSYP